MYVLTSGTFPQPFAQSVIASAERPLLRQSPLYNGFFRLTLLFITSPPPQDYCLLEDAARFVGAAQRGPPGSELGHQAHHGHKRRRPVVRSFP